MNNLNLFYAIKKKFYYFLCFCTKTTRAFNEVALLAKDKVLKAKKKGVQWRRRKREEEKSIFI